MKVSSVKVTLTEADIMSLIKDYLKIQGLEINRVFLGDFLEIKGSYKKGISIPFYVKLSIGNVVDNTLNVRIFKVKVMKVHIINIIKNLVLKLSLSSFKEYGIYVSKENINIDLDILSKKIPYIYFKLEKMQLFKGYIEATVDNVIYSQENNEKATQEEKEKENKFNKKYETIYKKKDNYSLTRKNLKIKLPYRYNKIFEYSMLIPDITVLLYRLFKDKRVDLRIKTVVVSVLSYVVSPIDIIPSFIPFIGQIDDMAVIFFGLNKIINEVPEEIILENWEGEGDIIPLVKEVVVHISNIIGTKNVKILMNFINKIVLYIKDNSNLKNNHGKIYKEREKAYKEVVSTYEKGSNIH